MADVRTRFVATGEDRTQAMFNKVSNRLKNISKQQRAFTSTIRTGVTALGIGFAARGISRAASAGMGLVTSLNETYNASRKLGMTVPVFESIARGFDLISGNGEKIANTIIPKMMQRLASGAAQKGLDRLGLTMKDLTGLAPDARFIKLVEALGKIGNKDIRLDAASSIFGRRTGHEVMGISNIQNLSKEYETAVAGLTLHTQKHGETANLLADGLGMLSKNIKTEFTSIILDLAGGLDNLAVIVALTAESILASRTWLSKKSGEFTTATTAAWFGTKQFFQKMDLALFGWLGTEEQREEVRWRMGYEKEQVGHQERERLRQTQGLSERLEAFRKNRGDIIERLKASAIASGRDSVGSVGGAAQVKQFATWAAAGSNLAHQMNVSAGGSLGPENQTAKNTGIISNKISELIRVVESYLRLPTLNMAAI